MPGWRRVRDKLALPLATGERLSTLAEMLPFITEGLVDVVQPDTGRFGGLTQMRKLAAIAEAHSLQVAPHSGSLGTAALAARAVARVAEGFRSAAGLPATAFLCRAACGAGLLLASATATAYGNSRPLGIALPTAALESKPSLLSARTAFTRRRPPTARPLIRKTPWFSKR
nr:enolase C-terminal domain-like protein [Paucibacter sp. M5-1]MCZ7883008.1 hypothetical protein [Paucibacter sp. M5-1]